MKKIIVPIFCAFAMMANAQTPKITLGGMLDEMVDTKTVTYFPDKEYRQKQFSSYDRNSARNDKNHYTWFANGDCSQFLYNDTINGRVEEVMFDAKGPGCITRWWMTFGGEGASDGIVRVYLDDAQKPLFEANAIDFLGYNPLIGYPLSASVSGMTPKVWRGHDFYLPIPYAKRCKITYENAERQKGKYHAAYYNINYREYTSDVDVESLTLEKLYESYDKLREINKALLNSKNLYSELPSGKIYKLNLSQGDTKTVTLKKKNSAISNITLKIDAADMEQALRSTVLKIRFDGNETVWVPLGDFFAVGPVMVDNDNWRVRVNAASHVFSTNWEMPFKKECELSFENLGTQQVDIDASVTTDDYAWNDRSMYFGASWFALNGVSTGENKHRMDGNDVGMKDINFVTLNGKGIYMGDVLTLYNTAQPGNAAWWGEGDEKVYVDNEDFPSHFGTGSEDYYGYAWCRPMRFIHPFVSLPIGDGNLTPGRTTNNRFRALDGITFQKSLKFDMELWHWSGLKINYSPTTFYYMLPGGVSNAKHDVAGARHKVAKCVEDVK